MVKSSQFYQALREGQIRSIILRDIDETSIDLFYYLHDREWFMLDRNFPTFNSALNYVIKALDRPVIPGLTEQYLKPPLVEIIKTRWRNQNEKNQHEQTSKPQDLP